jgi:hypothetical protein
MNYNTNNYNNSINQNQKLNIINNDSNEGK